MTERELASLIAKKEGLKSEARIGDIREIIKIIQNLLLDEVKGFEKDEKMPIAACLMKKADAFVKKEKK